MAETLRIIEVGPRDGLQNEPQTWSLDDRVELIRKLRATGLTEIEGGAFVSPKAIPQMQDSDKVWATLASECPHLSFLVPNEKGLERAMAAGVKHIAVFTATSEAFNQKNIGMSVGESLRVIEKVMNTALAAGLKVRAYVSTVFGCPYEGSQDVPKALDLIEKLLKGGAYEVSVGDTIGVAHPKQVKDFIKALGARVDLEKIAFHLHDTRGAALANILMAYEKGIRAFDSSIGGLGGCPYAQGSSGNIATEEVVWLLEGLGLKTGISLEGLLGVAAWVEGRVGRPLKGKLYLSRPGRLYYG